jgi:signal transduction histidine kinase/ActR/RegA family two-component response regulator
MFSGPDRRSLVRTWEGNRLDVRRELRPDRDFLVTVGVCLTISAVILALPRNEVPGVHSVLDTGMFLITGVLGLLLWDLGWRTAEILVRFKAVVFAVVSLLYLVHVLTALDVYGDSGTLERITAGLRPATWPPASYLLPIGLGVAAWLRHRGRGSSLALAFGMLGTAALLLWLFQRLPRYTAPGWLGITRPALVFVPLLWIPIALVYWRRRREDRIAHAIAFYAAIACVSHAVMLYSRSPADFLAMIAHIGVLGGGLFLLFSLIQMGTLDTARRMRAERVLSELNAALEARVRERTQELESTNLALRGEITTRRAAEQRSRTQLERLHLLHQITHAIGERQDLASIFQVVVTSLEDHLSVDFACMCHFDQVERTLTVARLGPRTVSLARVLELNESTRIAIDENGLSRCVRGELVYEADISGVNHPFASRLARGALRSVVLAPLLVEQRSGVFGILIVARVTPDAFSSSDCEFLNQLSENVALATNQAQLNSALQHAYDELRDTQQAILQQERLRALGQMASGIAHDINNAISPATLYVESILERDETLIPRTRQQLETVQRAIGDVAQTVARMGEFYRQRESQLEFRPVNINVILDQVPDLTRARWSNMAQAGGATIEVKIDPAPEAPTILGVESEIREALINLVFNAADAMPKGGTIVLRSRRSTPVAQAVSHTVVVEVCDDGAGMDEQTRSRCLEPFFTTKGERGSGLGLAMVYGIAQRHGADFRIDSELGKGTTVRLSFPEVTSTGDSTSRRELPGPVHAMRILIVDDDPLLLQSLRDALEFEGHEVFCSHGGQAGIDAFQASAQRKQPFPVVITDLGMPHVDGRQVAAAIKKAAPRTLVLMLTGWGQRLSETEGAPAHVDFVLNKPPNMWQLREALSRTLEKRSP